eukprot:366456-Chlamydomonas_euryale.AAC.14
MTAVLQQMGALSMRTDDVSGLGCTSRALAFLVRPCVSHAEAAEGFGRLQWERLRAQPLTLAAGIEVRQATEHLTAHHATLRDIFHKRFARQALHPAGWLASLPAGPEVVDSFPASLTGTVRFRKSVSGPCAFLSFPHLAVVEVGRDSDKAGAEGGCGVPALRYAGGLARSLRQLQPQHPVTGGGQLRCLPGGPVQHLALAQVLPVQRAAKGQEAARAHTLWDCSMAQAVAAQLQDALSAVAPGTFARADVWLLRPPATAVDSDDSVCA